MSAAQHNLDSPFSVQRKCAVSPRLLLVIVSIPVVRDVLSVCAS